MDMLMNFSYILENCHQVISTILLIH